MPPFCGANKDGGHMQTGIRNRAYKKVETILKNYRAIEQILKEVKGLQRGGSTGGAGSGHAFVSDPTALAAIKHTEPITSITLFDGYVVRQPEKWLQVIKYLYFVFPKMEGKAVKYFYDGHTAIETSVKFETSERNFYYIREDFRQACVELACQYGLVQVGKID